MSCAKYPPHPRCSGNSCLLVLGGGGEGLEGEVICEEELGEFFALVELLVEEVEESQANLSLLWWRVREVGGWWGYPWRRA